MDRIVVRGGAPLRGSAEVSGSKNATLALMAAALLSEEPSTLRNVPRVRDVDAMLELLRALGVRAEWDPDDGHTVHIEPGEIGEPEAPYELVRKMRASFMVLGPLLARCGSARVSEPGGCAIGVRPVEQHMRGLASLGAKVKLDHGYVEARAPMLEGATHRFDFCTVNGTQNVLMAACLARGRSVIENAAREPEVIELAAVLQAMGAQIEGAGSDRIVVDGVDSLAGMEHTAWGDRIEAGTLLAAAAITGGEVRATGLHSRHLGATLEHLESAGAVLEVAPHEVRLRAVGRPRPLEVETAPYPGFATDMQAQLMALLAVADGRSTVTETVFENRFMHVPELRRMGADIEVAGRSAKIRGVARLSGAPVMATDLRASASLIVAALAAEGESVVSRVYHIDRGYERIEEKFRQLGAEIRRES